MIIRFNPRISGGFVGHIINNRAVSQLVDDLELTDAEAHDFVKSVLIAGFNEFDVDINKIINMVKEG